MSREVKFRVVSHGQIIGYEALIEGRWRWMALPHGKWRVDTAGLYKLNNGQSERNQYTGLKDKNGVEIYEGDVVRNWWLKTAEPEVKAIVYYKNGFYLDDGLHNTWDAEDVEVIGNIYENPELLENAS